jgi:uncharacterized protein YcaQ
MKNPRDPELVISKTTRRQFILGKQGLYPGRRWRGKEGVAQAIRSGCVVQIDPLNVIARSHDIVLYGRVLDYQPALLEELMYTDRLAFDYGGGVMVHPMEQIPYWRVVMQRKMMEPRRVAFAEGHPQAIEVARAAVEERGPLGTRDLAGGPSRKGSFRSSSDGAQALYYLWLAGELMTHSRKGFERLYDLRERVVPPSLNYAASADEADDFFALEVFNQMGLVAGKSWRNWFAGRIERKVEKAEAAARLDALLAADRIATVGVEGETKAPSYILAKDLPLLEALQAGKLPEAWLPLETTTNGEAVFLAPLEIVSARGRAQSLFGFEYLWEVYKPEAERRWGYYTLPILYGDQLVARLDPKLERSTKTLVIKGFWLEPNSKLDEPFLSALKTGMRRFMQFIGAERLEPGPLAPILGNIDDQVW